jgi:hypothetical protein
MYMSEDGGRVMRISELLSIRNVPLVAALAIIILILGAAENSRSYAPPFIQGPTKGSSDQSSSPQTLTDEQIANFLRSAKVIRSKQSKKGITHPFTLTLSDGAITHDASFQSIDEHELVKKFDDGSMEINFHDSYHYNIAAYEIAKLIELGDMMPVYVERKWNGKWGSLSWYLPVKMDEQDRYLKKIPVPNVDAWSNQMYKIRVFSELLYNRDMNLTNVLIGYDWKLYVIDFTRAFRLQTDLQHPKDLMKCDRQLLVKLRQLNKEEVAQNTKGHLKEAEINALMKRRDKIVSHFQNMIAEQGENAVLY